MLRAAEIRPTCGLWWSSALYRRRVSVGTARPTCCFRRGVATDESFTIVGVEYGQFLQRRGRLATARPYLQRAVELAPDNPRMRQALVAFDALG